MEGFTAKRQWYYSRYEMVINEIFCEISRQLDCFRNLEKKEEILSSYGKVNVIKSKI